MMTVLLPPLAGFQQVGRNGVKHLNRVEVDQIPDQEFQYDSPTP